MRKPYLERIKEGIILCDGAMGTMLYEKGIFVNTCFEEACLNRAGLVEEIHQAYAYAGAQVLESNSYGANSLKLAGFGLADKCKAINQAAVKIARKVAGEELYVAGSIGACGQRLEPLGKISKEKAYEAFFEQASALAEAGADLFILETFYDIDELFLAVQALKEAAPQLPIQAQFSLGHTAAKEYYQVAAHFTAELDKVAAVDVIGVNCSVGPADMLAILSTMRKLTGKPVSVMPNAGLPKEIDGRMIYMASPEYFAEYAKRFWEGGANIIGGCCGTTPDHIKLMAKAVISMDRGERHIEVSHYQAEAAEKIPVPLDQRSALGKALDTESWITTIELVPPAGSDMTSFLQKIRELKGKGITCINIPDGPRASARLSPLITALEIERGLGIETVLHLCCRDKNLIGLQSDLLGIQASGLRNLLIITGDPPKVGRYPDVTGVFDVDAIGLLSVASGLNRGIDFGGFEIPGQTSLVLGAGANPASPFPEREIERVYKKAEAGAEFITTQPVFDIDLLIRFLKRIEGTGLPVIVGIWPLASYKNAQFLHNEVPGVVIPGEIMNRMAKKEDKDAARDEGILIAREILEKVRGSVQGVQVSPPFGRITTALEVLGL